MNDLQGKKLLILGATAEELSLVKRAQSFGIYTIVTDYHENWELSPAKKHADEAWNVSWSDIDALEKLCVKKMVNGVTAGYSEIRIESLIRLCERLQLPCYITMEQLEITRSKIKFKNECRKNGVPVVKEYKTLEDVNEFPVIVKPSDRAGSIGISIATNFRELEKAYEYAMQMSLTKQVIIEKYIEKGRYMDVCYVVEEGNIMMATISDGIMASNNVSEKVVQSGWVYPARYTKVLIDKVDKNLQQMIKRMGIKYGCIIFSCFINDNEDFAFFECGFRLDGSHQDEYASRKGPMNLLDVFISHALTGNTKSVRKHYIKNPNLKCVTINFYAKQGIISEIYGYDEIAKMEDCSLALVYGRIGQQCTDDKAILSQIAMFSFCNESPDKLAEDVDKAYAIFKTTNENGEDIIFDRIDSSQIMDWWD